MLQGTSRLYSRMFEAGHTLGSVFCALDSLSQGYSSGVGDSTPCESRLQERILARFGAGMG